MNSTTSRHELITRFSRRRVERKIMIQYPHMPTYTHTHAQALYYVNEIHTNVLFTQ